MPFHFTCPYCFKKTLVDDSLAGVSGPCVGCGKQVTIPGQIPVPAPAGLHPVDSDYVSLSPSDNNYQLATWLLKAMGLAVLLGVLAVGVIFLFWPAFENLRERRDRFACMNNLQQIAKALDDYAADHGTYPPPVTYDAQGKPMHSWRVMILSYLGEDSLFAQYNFDLPWDSQQNAQLFARCPTVFMSPQAGRNMGSESTYALITGNGTVFPASGPLAPWQVTDGLAETLLVVEVKNNTQEWTKPVDLNFGNLNRRIGAAGKNAIGGNHSGGATAVLADGTPVWLPGDLDPVLLDAMISADGGEAIDVGDLQLQ